MQRRRLGDSDLEVSVIALGSWLTYGGGVGRERTEECTRAAIDAGITLFDTADVYGRGAAERAWGEILRDYPRDSFAIATKLFYPMSAHDRGLSREQIHKQIDGSLERLGMDHVDLYQCHRYDEHTPLEETMEALTEVMQAARRAGSASASGRSSASRRRSRCPGWRSSSPASRSTRPCGASPRRASSRCASATASRRSCGLRSRRVS
jgi:aryl-alcohol dehydrogenase-like predicted oxidoreductase